MRRSLLSDPAHRVFRGAVQAGATRGGRLFALLTVVGCLAGAVQAAHPFVPTAIADPTEDRLASYDVPAEVGAAPLRITHPGYTVWAEPNSAVVSLSSADGREYTSLPLTVLAGRGGLPNGTHAKTTLDGSGLTTQLLAADGTVLSRAVLHPGPTWFTVTFSAPLGPSRTLAPAFFADSHRGLDMATIDSGYSPDPRGPGTTTTPVVSTVGRTPFAPPPLQFQLHGAPGWFGIGMVQVPSATTLRLARDGTVSLDYPLTHASALADFGAGPAQRGLTRFPDFVVTFSADTTTGLRAYHDALAALHAFTVASPPGSRPAWWSEPIVDTWGQQMAENAFRGSPAFTLDWVRHFVADWKARYNVAQFTLVIDSRWQERIGDAMPDPVRFGGMGPMRTLIDELHAQGVHVLLWWPMWAHRIDVIPLPARLARLAAADRLIDPTTPTFATDMARTVGELMGTGPDQLAADGLKLDWQYNIPVTLNDPGIASGALALYRYMGVIHTAAHELRPDAMIDASAAAPQFAAVSDTVRLYDAWTQTDWDHRAALVAAVNPDMLVDGDGWQVNAASIVPHTVSSTVYGTPAMYFSTTWMGGAPIPPALTQQLGSVVSLSKVKGQGRATPLPGGEWQYEVGKSVTARTFAHEQALVVRSPLCTPTWHSTVTSMVPGRLVVPMTGGKLVSAVDSAGHRAAASPVAGGVLLTVRAGGVYTLTFTGGC